MDRSNIARVRAPTAGKTPRLLALAKPIEVPHLVLWGFVWAACLLMTFEPQIRGGLGDTSSVLSTPILPGIWLSDVGLLLPILLVVFSPRLRLLLVSRRLLVVYGVVVVYGTIWGIVRDNFFSLIAAEFRISIALVTGLCLLLLIPRNPRSLARGMIGVSMAAVSFSAWVVSTSPNYVLANTTGIGVSDPVYFIVIGVALCLLAPSIILAHLAGSRRLILAAWFNVGLALVPSIVVALTRTLSYTILLSILLAFVGVWVLMYAAKQQQRLKRITIWFIIFALGIGWALASQQNRLDSFLVRIQLLGTSQDVNWLARVDEAQAAFEPMDILDHVFGQGFGIQSKRLTATGSYATNLHIGVLNVWWYLGLPTFIIFMMLLLRFGLQYLLSLTQALRSRLSSKTAAIIICAPGALALLTEFFISGGWSIPTMLSLGILWGVYNALQSLDLNLVLPV